MKVDRIGPLLLSDATPGTGIKRWGTGAIPMRPREPAQIDYNVRSVFSTAC